MDTSSLLTQILTNWIMSGGELDQLLRPVKNLPVANADEAKAICNALDILLAKIDRREYPLSNSSLYTLIGFFQQVDTQDASTILSRDGLPLIRKVIQNALDTGEASDIILFMLKVLALYRHESDVQIIADAAHKPLLPNNFMWSLTLNQFTADHPCSLRMVEALREPLPVDFISVAYLDMANALCLASQLETHPFASIEGVVRLTDWLKDPNEQFFSYARSATTALPFIEPESQRALLDLAKRHPNRDVKLEAAWAEAKLGTQEGITYLAEMCLNPAHSKTAKRYLEELGFTNFIPIAAHDKNLSVLAEMSAWLSHPMEYGRPPTLIQIFDSRELFWPPTKDVRRLWLVKYCYKDTSPTDEGVGMVGSITFALFGESTNTLSPEDIYALHCCWELQANRDPEAPKERTVSAGRTILKTYNLFF